MYEDDAEDDITTDEIKKTVNVGEEQIVASESKGGKCKSLFSEYLWTIKLSVWVFAVLGAEC